MLNKIMLIGHIGKDAELKTSPKGISMTRFSLATSEKWKDPTSNENKTVTTWHNIVIFGKLGEAIVNYLSKGTTVYVEGKVNISTYTDKNNNKQNSISVVASAVQLLKGNDKPKSNEIKFNDGMDDDTSQMPKFENDDIPF